MVPRMNIPPPDELVQRLHELRIKRGMTVQQMAEACGLPKSSLESYMRMDNARRPGVDALLAIAGGMDVTIDWLVGRAKDSFPPDWSNKDYAMSCFAVVQGLIIWMRDKQAACSGSIFEDRTVAGVPDADVAARSMLVFLENVQMFRDIASVAGAGREDLFNRISSLLDAQMK